MVLHVLQCKRPLCRCGGYLFAHRPGSPLCSQNRYGDVRQALRGSDDPLGVIAEWAWDTPGTPMKEWKE